MDVNQAQFTEEETKEIMDAHYAFTKLTEAQDYVGAVEFIDKLINDSLENLKYDHAIQYIMMKKAYVRPV